MENISVSGAYCCMKSAPHKTVNKRSVRQNPFTCHLFKTSTFPLWYDTCNSRLIENRSRFQNDCSRYAKGVKVSVKTAGYKRETSARRKKGAKKNATLTILNGCFAGLEIAIKKTRIVLGRNINCDVCLDDSLVSNEHAAIKKTDKGYTIEDLNSQSGMTLNRKKINQTTLHNGDMITIGNFRIKFSQ